MEAPARRSGAEPCRTKRALGGRCGVGNPGVSCVGWQMRSVYVYGGAAALSLQSPITLAFFHLSSSSSPLLTLLLLTCTPFTLLKTYCLFDYVHLRLRFFFLVDFHSRSCTSRLALLVFMRSFFDTLIFA
ncbi:hypothetical protein DFH08DRAFT_873791 [Mycena albidolilacea]|uniref:Uncharacterized protein n=1 Tax=Mycena albidolilacea TaxID=1033008 RepID=A0AAD7EPP8_9AGAR|nr:hypothetical protein DFH08DRAFT_873791 [Mycena albidolilacea]